MTVITAPARYSPMTSVPTSASTASASTPKRRCRAASITHQRRGHDPDDRVGRPHRMRGVVAPGEVQDAAAGEQRDGDDQEYYLRVRA